MCGICGEHRRDGSSVDADLLATMTASMVHRGPDDVGFHREPGVGLGFRRLSIIDLEGGNQPLCNDARTIFVLGNGEIYNHQELRSELTGLGYRFRTGSDIEVVVHGYEAWGVDVVDHLDGMFALAIWDAPRQTTVLVRDHLGIKPLYYHDDGHRLRFGSEMRTLLADPDMVRELDHDAVRLFLHFGYVPAPHTLLRGVHKLQPGHLLISDSSGARTRRYWAPTPETEETLTVAQAAERYTSLVSRAVQRQLISDVPVGVLLSGGVDSAMVLALAEGPIDTFTVGFDGDFQYDEAEDGAETAAIFGGTHHRVQLGLDSFSETFERSLWHLEEPVLSQSTFAYHLLNERVSDHLKVVLTGQGADEIWAGYDRYLGERYGARARWLFRSGAVKAVAERVPALDQLRRATASLGSEDPVHRFAAMHEVFSPAEVAAAARGPLACSDARAEDAIAYWQKPVADRDELTQLLHIDTRMSLADDLLFYGDKLSMAASVEARVPLLDRELVSFAESLPPSFKIRGRNGKYLHRLAAENLLPKRIVHRPKRGFATPIDQWFAKELDPIFRRLVLTEDSWCSRQLNPSFTRSLFDEHVSGRRNRRRQLTTLLSFEIVCRQLLDGAVPGELTDGVASAS